MLLLSANSNCKVRCTVAGLVEKIVSEGSQQIGTPFRNRDNTFAPKYSLRLPFPGTIHS